MITSTAFLSRKNAEQVQYDLRNNSTSLISIVSPDPDTKPVDFQHGVWSAVLYLQFHDVDPKGCSEEWKAQYVLFGDAQAKTIITFLDERAKQDLRVWAHCEGGISRSAAVAKFIAERYQLYFPEGYGVYNKHVYRTLVDVYYGSYRDV